MTTPNHRFMSLENLQICTIADIINDYNFQIDDLPLFIRVLFAMRKDTLVVDDYQKEIEEDGQEN